jgi:hypothetical protein
MRILSYSYDALHPQFGGAENEMKTIRLWSGIWRVGLVGLVRISVIVYARFSLIVDGETAASRSRREARKHEVRM